MMHFFRPDVTPGLRGRPKNMILSFVTRGGHFSHWRCSTFISTLGSSVLLRQALGRNVAPGGQKCAAHFSLLGSFQVHTSSTLASSAPLHGYEYSWISLAHDVLLFRRKLNHRPVLVGIAKSREDFSTDSKIRMRHVS